MLFLSSTAQNTLEMAVHSITTALAAHGCVWSIGACAVDQNFCGDDVHGGLCCCFVSFLALLASGGRTPSLPRLRWTSGAALLVAFAMFCGAVCGTVDSVDVFAAVPAEHRTEHTGNGCAHDLACMEQPSAACRTLGTGHVVAGACGGSIPVVPVPAAPCCCCTSSCAFILISCWRSTLNCCARIACGMPLNDAGACSHADFAAVQATVAMAAPECVPAAAGEPPPPAAAD